MVCGLQPSPCFHIISSRCTVSCSCTSHGSGSCVLTMLLLLEATKRLAIVMMMMMMVMVMVMLMMMMMTTTTMMVLYPFAANTLAGSLTPIPSADPLQGLCDDHNSKVAVVIPRKPSGSRALPGRPTSLR